MGTLELGIDERDKRILKYVPKSKQITMLTEWTGTVIQFMRIQSMNCVIR